MYKTSKYNLFSKSITLQWTLSITALHAEIILCYDAKPLSVPNEYIPILKSLYANSR